MRLTDLRPQWVGSGGENVSDADGKPVPYRHGVGLMCDCPCGCGSKLFVPFQNPLDGGPSNNPDRVCWDRTGDTFEVLTLAPSIRRIPHDGSCGWHGFIRQGMIETCGDSTPASPEFIANRKRFNEME